jgi:hypothetical protein
MKLSMQPYTEAMPDDPRMVAFRYGPLVLAARSDADLVLSSKDIRPLDRPATFAVTLADGKEVELVPLNQIVDEPFGVYFRLR